MEALLTDFARDGVWQSFTADRSKVDRYSDDVDFHLGATAATESFGRAAADVLRRHAFLLIQPDCTARRKAGRCLDFVEQRGFRPVHTVRVRLDDWMVERLWSFGSASWTTDSNTICDLVCGYSDSLLVVLRDDAPEPDLPASVRLTRLKGSAQPDRRSAEHLRTVIGADGPLVVLIHTSDEPLDMIREAAILCPSSPEELYSAMTRPSNDGRKQLLGLIEELNRESPGHDLDPDAAATRLRDAVVAAADQPGSHAVAQQLLAALSAARSGTAFLDWQPFVDGLRRLGLDPEGWDPIVIGSRYVRLIAEGTEQ
ncbi:MAG: hypothetical protein ACK5MT_07500 [Actinomycetales bacterium]